MWGEVRVSVEKILQAYRKQECLWDPKHPGYKNKQDRESAYIKVITDLNVPELTQNDIRLKIKSIRTVYRKELGLYLRRKSEGRYNAPKLVWFNQAHSFLKNVSIPKPARNNLNKKGNINKYETNSIQDDQLAEVAVSEEYSFKDDTEDPIHLDEENGTNECQKPTTNLDKKFGVSTDEDFIQMEYGLKDNQQTSFMKTNQNNININARKCNSHQYCSVLEPEDEYQKFCNSVAAQLRQIPDPYARAMAKFKIQQILFEAETGEYKKNPVATISISNITLPSSNSV